MKIVMDLPEDVIKLLKSNGTVLPSNSGDKKYYYLPIWFESTEDENRFIWYWP